MDLKTAIEQYKSQIERTKLRNLISPFDPRNYLHVLHQREIAKLIEQNKAVDVNFAGPHMKINLEVDVILSRIPPIFLNSDAYSKIDKSYQHSEEQQSQRIFDEFFNVKSYLIYSSAYRRLESQELFFTKYPICVDKVFTDAFDLINKYYPDYEHLNFDCSSRCDYQCLNTGYEEEDRFNKLLLKRSDHLYILIDSLFSFISIVLEMKNSIITKKSFPAICLISKIAVQCRYYTSTLSYPENFILYIKKIAYKQNLPIGESKVLYSMIFKELARMSHSTIMEFITNPSGKINPWAVYEIARNLDLYADPNKIFYIIHDRSDVYLHKSYFEKLPNCNGALGRMKQVATQADY